jgi:hypothetical protein
LIKHSSTSSKAISQCRIIIRNLIAIIIEILTICPVVERYLYGTAGEETNQIKELLLKKPVVNEGWCPRRILKTTIIETGIFPFSKKVGFGKIILYLCIKMSGYRFNKFNDHF